MISDMLRFPFFIFDEEPDKLFQPDIFVKGRRLSRSNYPAVNIGTTDKSVEVYLFVPGMEAKDLEVEIEKNMLSIAGERKSPDIATEKDASIRQERYTGPFKRTITLPDTVYTESTKAVYKNGVLHISIAKHAESQPKQIKVYVQ